MTDFVHHLRLDQVRDGDRVELNADEAERTAVAERLGLDRIERMEAHAALSRTGDKIRARGRLMAALQQTCVVTGDPVSAHIDAPFDIIFLPEPKADEANDEIELQSDDCDVVFHDGAAIDLGGAIADTLALSIDPYPRSAGAEAALKEAGVLSEAEAGPFAVLAKLKRGESE